MAKFEFTARPRKANTNEPLTYDIAGPEATQKAGTLVKQKNKWCLKWLGTSADFDTKRSLVRHFNLLGHTVEGLL